MAERHQIRDPVHNFVELWEKEIRLIGTPLFQRLRGIRQLALANLVYPGALHTRFDHSLGVCHVAGLLAKHLGLNDDAETSLVRLAALLHDLGHGPFSHVSESLLDRYADTSRRLFKRVFQERIQKFAEVEVRAKLLKIAGEVKTQEERNANDTLRKGIEAALAEILSAHFHDQDGEKVEPREVILHAFDIKSVRTTSRNDESGISIATRGTPLFFQDESALFGSINESYTEGFVEVYAPAPLAWSDRTNRSKSLQALKTPLRERIESIIKPTLQGEA